MNLNEAEDDFFDVEPNFHLICSEKEIYNRINEIELSKKTNNLCDISLDLDTLYKDLKNFTESEIDKCHIKNLIILLQEFISQNEDMVLKGYSIRVYSLLSKHHTSVFFSCFSEDFFDIFLSQTNLPYFKYQEDIYFGLYNILLHNKIIVDKFLSDLNILLSNSYTCYRNSLSCFITYFVFVLVENANSLTEEHSNEIFNFSFSVFGIASSNEIVDSDITRACIHCLDIFLNLGNVFGYPLSRTDLPDKLLEYLDVYDINKALFPRILHLFALFIKQGRNTFIGIDTIISSLKVRKVWFIIKNIHNLLLYLEHCPAEYIESYGVIIFKQILTETFDDPLFSPKEEISACSAYIFNQIPDKLISFIDEMYIEFIFDCLTTSNNHYMYLMLNTIYIISTMGINELTQSIRSRLEIIENELSNEDKDISDLSRKILSHFGDII